MKTFLMVIITLVMAVAIGVAVILLFSAIPMIFDIGDLIDVWCYYTLMYGIVSSVAATGAMIAYFFLDQRDIK